MLVQGGSMKLVKEIPDSDSQEEWLARERAHLSQVLYRYTPLVIEHAKGSYLYTVDGRRYLDFASGIAVTNLGHGHPEVIRPRKTSSTASCIFQWSPTTSRPSSWRNGSRTSPRASWTKSSSRTAAPRRWRGRSSWLAIRPGAPR